jgi:hypothetical protein
LVTNLVFFQEVNVNLPSLERIQFNERFFFLIVKYPMKRIAVLITFLTFCGISFAQQTADSCSIVVPTNLQKEGCGEQQVHLHFESKCGIHDFEITIFNRWGNQLHVSNQLDYSLSGKILNQGTYYYAIKGTFLNGAKINQNGFFNVP